MDSLFSHGSLPVLFLRPDTEIPESPRRSVSLAPSSQCTLSLPSSRALAKRHKQTPARRNHPYDVDHHSKSKASAACAQGASDKSIAWPGGDSLKYAQGVALYPPSRGSSSGGKFRCILVHFPGLDILSSPSSFSNATG